MFLIFLNPQGQLVVPAGRVMLETLEALPTNKFNTVLASFNFLEKSKFSTNGGSFKLACYMEGISLRSSLPFKVLPVFSRRYLKSIGRRRCVFTNKMAEMALEDDLCLLDEKELVVVTTKDYVSVESALTNQALQARIQQQLKGNP